MVRFALRNPYLVVVSILALVLLGGVIIPRTPLDILPIFKTPAVQILTLYPGMPTGTMESDITNRIERWTSQANGVARQESKTLTGVSVVRDYFNSDVDPNAALSQVSSLAMSDLYYLPPGTVPPMVMPYDPASSTPLVLLTLSSATLDETQLYDIAYFNVRNMLSGTPGVVAPAVFGGRIRRVLVYVDPVKLSAHGMSPLDVANGLRKWNVFIPTGDANIGATDYMVVANGNVPKIEDINQFPLKIVNGAPVFVRDIGYAQDSFEIQSNVVHVNGKRQVYIPIYRQPGANTVQVVKNIRASLPALKARIPSNVQLNLIADQSFYVRRALSSLERELILGACLAGLMVLLFLGSIRSSAVIFITIPLSITFAIIGLFFTGNSINSMTLGGLALAVGRLVDDAIVVLENITRHLEMGKSPAIAARDGAQEVALPVVVSTLTTMIVFLPVFFLKGVGRFLFTPLAITVAFAMAASYILAMTLVPVFAAHFLHAENHEAGARQRGWRSWLPRIAAKSESVHRPYRRVLERAIGARWWVLGGVALLFAVSLLLYPLLGRELFPSVDAGQIVVRMRAPSGTRIDNTEKLAFSAEAAIRRVIPATDIDTIVANTGVLYDWPAAYTPNAGPMDTFFAVQLTSGHRTTSQAYARQLRTALAADFPGVGFSFDTGGLLSAALNSGLPSPIDVQVTGNDLAKAQTIALQVKQAINETRGTVDARIEQTSDYPQLNVQIDRVKAAYLGLTTDDVVKNLLTALNSSITFQPAFWLDEHNGNHYFLGAQYPESAIQTTDTLANIPLTGSMNMADVNHALDATRMASRVPPTLRQVAAITRSEAPVEASHLNLAHVTDIYSDIDGRDTAGVVHDLQQRLDKLALPSGYKVALRGEIETMNSSFSGMGLGLAMAVILVYLLLVAQFRSFLDPAIILISVPLGIIGVIAILLVTGTTLNIQSYLGTIFMVGIAVSNSVLLVDFANRRRAEGVDLREAVVEASTVRLRPILMTSIAAIIGLLPMAFDLAPGAEANVPLARAVVGGLAASTVLTLFVVPLVYLLVKRDVPPPNQTTPVEEI